MHACTNKITYFEAKYHNTYLIAQENILYAMRLVYKQHEIYKICSTYYEDDGHRSYISCAASDHNISLVGHLYIYFLVFYCRIILVVALGHHNKACINWDSNIYI